MKYREEVLSRPEFLVKVPAASPVGVVGEGTARQTGVLGLRLDHQAGLEL